MAEPPGQYSTQQQGRLTIPNKTAQQFVDSENLGSVSPSSSGQTAQGFNPNLWMIRDEDTGNLRGVDFVAEYGADSDAKEAAWLYPEIANTQQDLQNENALAYGMLTDNSGLLSLAVDKNGFTQNYLSGVAVYGDTRNWAIQSTQVNMNLANAWYAENTDDRLRLSVPEAARAFLESRGVKMNGKGIMEAALKYGSGGGGGGGAPSTVSTVKKTNAQNVRAQADIANATIGRTVGRGESKRLAKQLNKESAKNPSVTTGLGTANQTQTPGYDFRQGMKEALMQTSDGQAYQKLVRGVNILGRALGGQA